MTFLPEGVYNPPPLPVVAVLFIKLHPEYVKSLPRPSIVYIAPAAIAVLLVKLQLITSPLSHSKNNAPHDNLMLNYYRN